MSLYLILFLTVGPADAADLTDDEALQMQAQIIAAEEGWSEDATLEYLQNQRSFNQLVETIATNFPTSYSDALNLSEPGGVGIIYFKGNVPTGAATQIDAAAVPAVAVGDRAESATEILAHADAVVGLLLG